MPFTWLKFWLGGAEYALDWREIRIKPGLTCPRQHRYRRAGSVAGAYELGRSIRGAPVYWKECLYRFGLRRVFPEPESPKGYSTLKNVRLYAF
jgi:hypothetical protein